MDFDIINSKDINDINFKRTEIINKRKNKNENIIYNLILINFQYIKLISNDIHSLMNWNDKWRTLFIFIPPL